MLHAGGCDRWVDSAELVFLSKTNSTDYHDEMNSEHYSDWLKETLLLQIQGQSVIVIDNTTYYNNQVDKASTTIAPPFKSNHLFNL